MTEINNKIKVEYRKGKITMVGKVNKEFFAGLVVVVFIVMLLMLLPRLVRTPQFPNTIKKNLQNKEVTRDTPTGKDKAKYRSFIDKGIELYKKGEYYKAAYHFNRAAAEAPKEPEAKYYLLLCYEQVEKPPYPDDSYVVRLALEIKALFPDSDYSKHAGSIIEEYEKSAGTAIQVKETNVSPSPNKVSEKKKGLPVALKTKKTKVLPPPIPVISDSEDYPLAGEMGRPVKPPEVLKVPQVAAKKTPKTTENPIITLSGVITRSNEKGNTFNPAGVNLKLMNMIGAEDYATVTDKDGKFKFTGVVPSDNYILIALNNYSYTRYITEYYNQSYHSPYVSPNSPYYNKNVPYPYLYYNPYSYHYSYSVGSVTGSYDDGNAQTYGYGPLNGPVTRINSGDGYIYYGPKMDYASYTRSVEVDLSMSWHVRFSLDKPGRYHIILDGSNADNKYNSAVNPAYNAVTHEPFEQVTDLTPIFQAVD